MVVTRRSGGDRRYSVVDDGQEDPLGTGDGCDGHECRGWGAVERSGKVAGFLGSISVLSGLCWRGGCGGGG